MKRITGIVATGLMLLAGVAPAMEYALDKALTPENLMPKGEDDTATAPDTLDLAERARLSVRGLANFLNPLRNTPPSDSAISTPTCLRL